MLAFYKIQMGVAHLNLVISWEFFTISFVSNENISVQKGLSISKLILSCLKS